MKNRFAFTKRRRILLATVIMSAALITGLTVLMQTRPAAQAAILNPHPGLVGWWRFDEGTGTVATDSSGNGNNGTIYSAAWVTGKCGQALSFNGASNYVSVPNAASLNFGTSTDFSISCWLKAGQSGATQFLVVDDYGSPGYWQLWISNGNVLRFTSSDGGPSLAGTVNICDGAWYFVSVVCRRSTTAQLYVDGLADGSAQNMAGGNVSSNVPVRFGSANNAAGWFNGIIDEVRIFNRALSATEIQESFQRSPDFSSMILAQVPNGTTQFIATLSWQGIGSINVTIQSPSQNYTEAMMSVYQKTVYSTSSGISNMLNIKRVAVPINALTSDQNWYVILTYSNVQDYSMSVEVQK